MQRDAVSIRWTTGGPILVGSYSTTNAGGTNSTVITTTVDSWTTGMGEDVVETTVVTTTSSSSSRSETTGTYVGAFSSGDSSSSTTSASSTITSYTSSQGGSWTQAQSSSNSSSSSSAFDNHALPSFAAPTLPAYASYPSGPWDKPEKDDARPDEEEDLYAESEGHTAHLKDEIVAAAPSSPAGPDPKAIEQEVKEVQPRASFHGIALRHRRSLADSQGLIPVFSLAFEGFLQASSRKSEAERVGLALQEAGSSPPSTTDAISSRRF